MFRTIGDFAKTWEHESASTLKLLQKLTDESLAQAVAAEDRTLGRIAWHITLSVGEMMERTGLKLDGPGERAPVPSSAAEIARVYEATSRALARQIEAQWTDSSLEVEDDMYGQRWKRGFTVSALVAHQTHHRGQMTVLMRQAGLAVPGVYGPARHEWGAMGMEAPPV
jgi:uncharacterized damage-inducible protein DinB